MKHMKISMILLILVLAFSLCACGGGSITTGEASEYVEGGAEGGSTAGGEVTIVIECKTILDNMEKLDSAKTSLVPEDGVILAETTVTFEEGDTVLDILKEVTKENKIQMEFEESPAYEGGYVNSINNLYEFDCGPASGWEYFVNDWEPNYGCGKYILSDGDVIAWRYTCDLGQDL